MWRNVIVFIHTESHNIEHLSKFIEDLPYCFLESISLKENPKYSFNFIVTFNFHLIDQI